jgi:hypothetical protein
MKQTTDEKPSELRAKHRRLKSAAKKYATSGEAWQVVIGLEMAAARIRRQIRCHDGVK